MEPRKFDDLTKALASGATRRGVLKGMVGSAVGGALGMLGLSGAHAQDDCPGGKVDVCHRTNSRRNPYRYISICIDSLDDHLAHGDTYCEGNFLPDGECGCFCPAGDIVCDEGYELNMETCECELSLTCSPVEACGAFCGEGDCTCVPTTEGGSICHQGQTCAVSACTTSDDCPGGEVCAQTCCEQLICVLPCGQVRQGLTALVDDGPWSVPRQ